MNWRRMLACVTGSVDEELLKRNEYLVTENRILRAKLKGRVPLDDSDRITLAKIGKKLGRRVLAEVARIVSAETILGWHRRLVASKFNGSAHRKGPGRPRIEKESEALIVRMALENRRWGYDHIVGELKQVGIRICKETVQNVLKRNGIVPAPERRKHGTWKEFIASHRAALAATDFFTVEAWSPWGLVTYYVLFFIRVGSRKVEIAGITEHPHGEWMKQAARNATMAGWGFLEGVKYLLHDRDTKYTEAFRSILVSAGVEPLALPPHSPNLNAYAERFVLSIKSECLDHLILFGGRSVERVVREYAEEYYRRERPHQGMGNGVLEPDLSESASGGPVRCRRRLGGLLRHYYRGAA